MRATLFLMCLKGQHCLGPAFLFVAVLHFVSFVSCVFLHDPLILTMIIIIISIFILLLFVPSSSSSSSTSSSSSSSSSYSPSSSSPLSLSSSSSSSSSSYFQAACGWEHHIILPVDMGAIVIPAHQLLSINT